MKIKPPTGVADGAGGRGGGGGGVGPEGDVAGFRHALVAWFRGVARDLPWRRSPSPWAVLVSEVMLQQTRVETVVPYFERWMVRFPTPGSLAEADEQEVLRWWQGLGFYRRARALHGIARQLVEHHEGAVPAGVAELRALKGVGPYTAAAVASIAFGEAAGAVDGNVLRVLARLYVDDGDIMTSGVRRRMQQRADRLVAPGAAGDFNQAMMELGATVCTPRRADCGRCPVAEHCGTRRAGLDPLALPVRIDRTKVRRESRPAWIVTAQDTGRHWVVQRPAGGLLGGLWEYPLLADGAALAVPGDHAAVVLDAVRHRFSHIDLTMTPVWIPVPGERDADALTARTLDGDDPGYTQGAWRDADARAALPRSAMMQRLERASRVAVLRA